MMTQGELITRWEEEAAALEAEADVQGNYLSAGDRERNYTKAEVLRGCASDLKGMTY